MEYLRKIAATLAEHGQHDLAREVADLSMQMKRLAGLSDSQEFVALLKSGGASKIKYTAASGSGTAYVPRVGTIEFSASGNDDAVWVEIPSIKFKADAETAANALEGIRSALP